MKSTLSLEMIQYVRYKSLKYIFEKKIFRGQLILTFNLIHWFVQCRSESVPLIFDHLNEPESLFYKNYYLQHEFEKVLNKFWIQKFDTSML